jgi:hypothetical protein
MDPILTGDHRAVPLEVLREFARSQAESTSIRNEAEDAGVGRSTVHKFISAGTMPHPRIRRLLALWYLRRREGVELELIRPYAHALSVLITGMPGPSRERVTRAVLDNIEEGFASEGEEAPRWLEALRSRVGRQV